MTPTEQREKLTDECCELANKKFGIEVGLKDFIDELKCCSKTKAKIVELYQSREIDKAREFVSEVKSSKHYYVTITDFPHSRTNK
jgi:hypothetical protein